MVMHKFLKDFSSFANNRDIKHIAHKLSPITDAAINKAAGAIQSLKTGGRVKGAKKGAPKIIKAHVGEYVLGIGIKPTKAQVKATAKRVAKAKK